MYYIEVTETPFQNSSFHFEVSSHGNLPSLKLVTEIEILMEVETCIFVNYALFLQELVRSRFRLAVLDFSQILKLNCS